MPLTRTQIAQKLAQIDALTAQVMEGLENTESTCPTCQHNRHSNWEAFKLANELGAVRTKMQRWVGRFLLPPGEEVG